MEVIEGEEFTTRTLSIIQNERERGERERERKSFNNSAFCLCKAQVSVQLCQAIRTLAARRDGLKLLKRKQAQKCCSI